LEAAVKKPSSKASANSRFIPSEEIDAVAQWQFAAVSDAALDRPRTRAQASEDAAAQLLLLEQAREEGRLQGQEQGYARAAAEAKQEMDDFYQRQGHATAERLALCAQAFEARWEAAEQALAQGVLDLSCALARQVVRRELLVDPKALEPVIREALGMLASDAKAIVVRLHPADFDLLESALRESFVGEALLFRADAAVPEGGCLVEAGGMTVDGTLERRWSRTVATLGLSAPWQEEVSDA
jgi:flagellar assembly protein FliH